MEIRSIGVTRSFPLKPHTYAESGEFSLVFGGPLYQLWRRMHLSGAMLELVRRRIAVITLLAWAPLFVLSALEGRAWPGTVSVPFLSDVEPHARMLLALPLLIAGELFVYRRLRWTTRLFLERGLIPEPARPRFERAIASAMSLRNSVTAEILLVLFVVVGVGLLWRTRLALEVPSWYGTPMDGELRLSLAGWWLICVSLPIFQFMLLRWYFRLFIWARFLWHVSRIDLRLAPTHPDRCGGLGFVGFACHAFAPLLLAQGTVLAGVVANRIFYEGANLLEFKVDFIGLVVGMVLAILTPLLVFTRQLVIAKHEGEREFGTLAMRYVREFQRKWLREDAHTDDALLGSADVQSLADLASSFEVPRQMKFAPFSIYTVLQLAIITILPALPLILTMFSFQEILDKVLNMFL